MICRRCIVTGLVQGVAYRATTQRRAHELNITGYAKNLPDGSVEVLACGNATEVESLCAWLWTGPRAANVRSVQCEVVANTPPNGFATF